MQIFTPHFAIIAPRSGVARQGIMDDTGQHGYRFDNASMTESCRVEVGPLPSLGLGLGGRNQIEVCEVAEISRLGAPRRHRPLSRIAWRGHDAGQLGAGRRHPRRTQAADAFQLESRASPIAGAGSRRSASSHRTARSEFEEFAQGSPARRRDHRARFQRRLGQRFHRARPALPQSRRADHRRRHRARRRPRRANARASTPEAYCESMCVFLLLSGKTRYVPPVAHVRVHQIWMGDRADDAKAASYTAQDLMIVERDIGRLAKYTFDMGGTGDLLSLALSVPPWEDLHEIVARRIAADQSGHDRCGRRRVPAATMRRCRWPRRSLPSRAGSFRQFRRRGRRAAAAGEVDQDRRSRGSDRRRRDRAGPAAEVGLRKRCHHPRRRMIQYAAAS